jgi:cytochrome P450 family 142 subfamily A polypeptide 1
MLDELLARVPDLEIADPDAELVLRPANFVSGLERLPVRFSPTAKTG